MIIAGATMILGNVAAIKQQSMKRLLAYSSIAHVGYMLLYLFMNTGAFAVLIYLQGKNEGEYIEDFKGMGKRHPMLAFSMLVFLLSLAGIPPFIGFFGKFYIFLLAVEQGYITLVVIALLTSAISAFYYLEVVKQMYFKEPTEGEVEPMDSYSKFLISTTCALVLIGTVFGPQLLKWTDDIRWFEKEAPAAAVMEYSNK